MENVRLCPILYLTLALPDAADGLMFSWRGQEHSMVCGPFTLIQR
jgi:hypothetical protein